MSLLIALKEDNVGQTCTQWPADLVIRKPESLAEEYGADGLRVVGVSIDTGDAWDIIQEFVDEYGVTYTILADPQMRGMDTYQILGLPGTFLIDRDGTLQWMRYGPVSESDEQFLQAIADALQ